MQSLFFMYLFFYKLQLDYMLDAKLDYMLGHMVDAKLVWVSHLQPILSHISCPLHVPLQQGNCKGV